MKFFVTLLCFLTIGFSCRKALEKPTWDVNLLSPLVNTTLTLNDLLPIVSNNTKIQFVNLQYGDVEEELKIFNKNNDTNIIMFNK